MDLQCSRTFQCSETLHRDANLKKIQIREIANVAFFDPKKLRPVQSKDLQIKSQKFIKYQKIFPHKYKKWTKICEKNVFKLGAVICFVQWDLVTRTEEREIWAVSGRRKEDKQLSPSFETVLFWLSGFVICNMSTSSSFANKPWWTHVVERVNTKGNFKKCVTDGKYWMMTESDSKQVWNNEVRNNASVFLSVSSWKV